jgi:hypothetical protein
MITWFMISLERNKNNNQGILKSAKGLDPFLCAGAVFRAGFYMRNDFGFRHGHYSHCFLNARRRKRPSLRSMMRTSAERL